MIRIKLLSAFLVSAVMLGCATPGPNISNIEPSTIIKSFALDEAYFWKQKISPLATSESEFGLAKGLYRSEKQNEAGTLFRGPGRCVAIQLTNGYQVSSGGLWIPNDPREKMRLYVYAYTDQIIIDNRSDLVAMLSTLPTNTSNVRDDSEPQVVTIYSPVKLSPAQAGAASGIGTAIVSGLIAAEVAENRGKPFLQWEITDTNIEPLTQAQIK